MSAPGSRARSAIRGSRDGRRYERLRCYAESRQVPPTCFRKRPAVLPQCLRKPFGESRRHAKPLNELHIYGWRVAASRHAEAAYPALNSVAPRHEVPCLQGNTRTTATPRTTKNQQSAYAVLTQQNG